MITWKIIAVLSVVIPGDVPATNGTRLTYADKFVSYDACMEYKLSDAFHDSDHELMALARARVNNPHAKINFTFTCEAVGEPA